jgi:hypothetical protein
LSTNFPALPFSNLGTYSIKVTLNVDPSDNFWGEPRCRTSGLKDYFFNVNVLNRPPIFDLAFTTSFTLNLQSTPITYNFPTYSDPEGHPISPPTASASKPGFVNFSPSPGQIVIAPTLCSECGTHTFDILLSDTN